VPTWPPWWDWELDLGSHLFKRMADRGFNEVDVRAMLAGATALRPDVVSGRWVAATKLRRRAWEVIVEPDEAAQLLVVVTAYPLDR
jgi:hypothetical protein